MSETPSFKKLFDPIQDGLKQVEADIRAGNLKAAAERLNLLQREAPRDARIFLMGVPLAETAGNYAAAVQSAERAVGVAPHLSVVVIELAVVLARQGQLDRALIEADKAIAMKNATLAVCERATSIANMAADHERVGQYLRAAQAKSPDDLSIRRALAYNLLKRNDHDGALAVFGALMAVEPTNELVQAGRARAALAAGDSTTAIADFGKLKALYPDNDIYDFYLDVASGRTPKSQPVSATQELFDGYARRFDKHLVSELRYQVPRRIAEIIRARFPSLAVSVLDLGCGTGLVGVYLGKPQGGLVGVDISEKMIAEAAKHKLYDRFHQVSLIDALTASPSGEFEVITAADVFIYVGEIEQAINDARRILRDEGLFVFSCEATVVGEPDLVLRKSLRYAHSERSVRAACEAAGFKIVDIEAFDLRNEHGAPIAGFIVSAST